MKRPATVTFSSEDPGDLETDERAGGRVAQLSAALDLLRVEPLLLPVGGVGDGARLGTQRLHDHASGVVAAAAAPPTWRSIAKVRSSARKSGK